MWHDDGWGAVMRLGVLTPHADVGPEAELQAMAPDGVAIHAARVPFGAMAAGGLMDPTIPLAPVRAFAEPPHIDDAADLLAAAPIAAIGIGFTSSAYLIGAEGETAMVARLRERTGGIPVAATCPMGVLGLRKLGVDRLMLVDPPWFDDELNELGAAFFRDQGFEVVSASSAALPSDQRQIDPEGLYAYVRETAPDDADGVFIGGNGFRAVGVIEALEEALGRPVLTANQVLLWGLLAQAGSNHSVSGYGRLFAS